MKEEYKYYTLPPNKTEFIIWRINLTSLKFEYRHQSSFPFWQGNHAHFTLDDLKNRYPDLKEVTLEELALIM